MAGRGHHFIPQLLLKGFSSGRTQAGVAQVWVCRRGQEPVLTSTKNVAKQRDFYGEPDSELDSLITVHEGLIADSVRGYRDAAFSCRIGKDTHAVDLIVLASVRTRWIRAAFEQLVTEALERFDALVRQQGDVGFLLQYIEQNPDWWIDTVRREVVVRIGRDDSTLVNSLAAGLLNMLRAGDLPRIQEHNDNALQDLLSQTRAIVPEMCRRGHIRGIRGLFGESGWRDEISSWEWRLKIEKSGNYLLGDFGPLFVSSSNEVGPFGIYSSGMSGVVMAVGRQTLLVGGEVSEDALLAPEEHNRVTAEWSLETLVCNDASLLTESIQRAMGRRIDDFVRETVRESLCALDLFADSRPTADWE